MIIALPSRCRLNRYGLDVARSNAMDGMPFADARCHSFGASISLGLIFRAVGLFD